MAVLQHLERLKADHASIELALNEELHRPLPDPGLISDLKRRKLRIKDEIVKLADAH